MANSKPKSEVTAVVGGQWGDEGKGKIIDYLAASADIIIRAQGGDNAGHTVVNDQGKFALHLIPAGIFNPDSINIIGAGTALNPKTLLKEISELSERKVSINNLRISPKAHLAFDYHLWLDRKQEDDRGKRRIETTKRGIGPTYMDKAERIGLPARLLLDPARCLETLDLVLRHKIKQLRLDPVPDEFKTDSYRELIQESGKILQDFIVPTEEIVTDALADGKNFLIEGAHGALLDLDHGTYPMVTASNSTVGGLLAGSGLPPLALTRVVGVFKAYQTRVGAGGMPTELHNAQGDAIREKGHEYGTTTGRPRRVGFFDGVASRYANQINGFTDIAVTRIDTLAEMGDLNICRNYQLDGKQTREFPVDDIVLSQCQPEYEHFTGWTEDLSGAKTFAELPQSVQTYCHSIVKTMPGAHLSFVGTGQNREALIKL